MRKLYALAMAAVMLPAGLYAQNFKSSGSTKYVLLEEGTGTWCQFCPDGQVKMMQILGNSSNQNRVNAVALHNNDGMAIADPNTVLSAYSPAWPNGGVDRVLNTTQSKVFMSRSYWQTYVTQQLAVAPGFQIDLSHSYNATTRAINVTVKVKALTAQTGAYNINCYIVEDSVTGTGTGYNQINAYNTDPSHPYYQAGNPIVGFVHRHVAREMLGGPWGTTGVIANNPPANGTYTKTYTSTLPGTTSYTRWKIIAYVQRHDASVVNNRIIMNSLEADVTPGSPAGITEVAENITNLSVYPNPATDNIFVAGVITGRSDVNIAVVNSVGQTVIQKQYNNMDGDLSTYLSLEGLTSGIYFVTVSANGTKRTERVMVTR